MVVAVWEMVLCQHEDVGRSRMVPIGCLWMVEGDRSFSALLTLQRYDPVALFQRRQLSAVGNARGYPLR